MQCSPCSVYHVLVGFPRMKSIALKTSEGTALYIAIEDGAYCKLSPGVVWGDFSGHSQSYCNRKQASNQLCHPCRHLLHQHLLANSRDQNGPQNHFCNFSEGSSSLLLKLLWWVQHPRGWIQFGLEWALATRSAQKQWLDILEKSFLGVQDSSWLLRVGNVSKILRPASYSCSVTQLCPILCNPMDYSPSGSSVLGFSQAKILEWVAISFSRGSSQPTYLKYNLFYQMRMHF